jgi:glutamyl-tRNA synthetase
MIRTRFAPSPTGHVHIGNIRTAIYNWLYARHMGGQFLLRVEDTDRERSTPEAVQAVLDAMDWLGLSMDEEPVYQSQNLEAHQAAAETLLSKGLAYKLDKGGTGQGEAVLLKMPGTDLSFVDEIKGTLSKKAENMEDFVIVRSNGRPVFHLANVVDDINMNISHVIRGDDHVENTYRHIALYQALGAPVPKFAHLPMITNPQGKPYSKRDGDAFVGDFREKGYLADALFNFLVLLGWSSGDEQEVFTRDELVSRFDFDRVQSSPAQMDFKKLEWMNGEYLRSQPDEVYRSGCSDALNAAGLSVDPGMLDQILPLLRDRMRFFSDAPQQAGYFLKEDYPFDRKAVKKRLAKEGVAELLSALAAELEALPEFSAEKIGEGLNAFADAREISLGQVNPAVRVAVSGQGGGPELVDILAILGRERSIARIRRACDPAFIASQTA